MYKCPYCERETISFLDKLFHFHSDYEKCSHCRGEWTMSKYRYFYFVFFFLTAGILSKSSFVFWLIAILLYCVVVALYPIKRIHEKN